MQSVSVWICSPHVKQPFLFLKRRYAGRYVLISPAML